MNGKRKMKPGVKAQFCPRRICDKGMEVCVQKREEAAMIAAVLAGDTQLYHELIRPHERRVYRMALSYMKNEHWSARCFVPEIS